MIGETVGHYKILRRLGAGGMGEVFLAQDTRLSREVALKFLPGKLAKDPIVLERFQREAQAAATLNHPNIITVHEVALHEERPYIVMEHVPGLPLDEFVAERSVGLEGILDLAIQVAEGLAKAHAAGIVHRDLKPANILVDDDRRPRILDFGLAKRHELTQITQEASTLGTAHYMSPEQTRGQDVDHRSDIFSLGCVLYELIARQRPFTGENQSAVMHAIATKEPQPLRRYNNEVSEELERIVAKMLAKKPGERYASAADLAVDLRRARRISEEIATGGNAPASSSRWLKLGVPALVAAMAALLLWKTLSPQPETGPAADSADNSLAVLYFENLATPDPSSRTGEIIANLLITALADVEGLRIVSNQRLYDLLHSLNRDGTQGLDRNTATEVATRAGARSMLLGSIVADDPMILTWQLVDVRSGDVVESDRVEGKPSEPIFSVVDRLTVDLSHALALPEQETAIAERTTDSAEAYRLYIEGLDYYWKNMKVEFNQRFRAVLDIDSTMAMAALYLSMPNNFPLSPRERGRYASQALRHSDKLPERDRQVIRSIHATYFGSPRETLEILQDVVERDPQDKEAWYLMAGVAWNLVGDVELAIDAARRCVEIDPQFKLGYNTLAYAQLSQGNHAAALEAVDNYILVAPNEPNPYDTRGEIYGAMGRLDDAIKWYSKAIELSGTTKPPQLALAPLYFYKHEDDRAIAMLDEIIDGENPGMRSVALSLRAWAPTLQGRFREAIDLVDGYLETGDGERGMLLVSRASMHAWLGNFDEALRDVREATSVGGTSIEEIDWGYEAEMLAWSGDTETAAAMIESHPLDAARATVQERADDLCLRGIVAYFRGDLATACELLDEACATTSDYYYEYWRARSYVDAGRSDQIASHLQKLASSYGRDRIFAGYLSTHVHYLAGIALEETEQYSKAAAQYDEFLRYCVEPDPEAASVADAKKRLEALRQRM